MALYLAKEIGGEDLAKAIQLLIEYDPQPPFESGSLQKAPATIIGLAERQLTKQLTKELGQAFLSSFLGGFRSPGIREH